MAHCPLRQRRVRLRLSSPPRRRRRRRAHKQRHRRRRRPRSRRANRNRTMDDAVAAMNAPERRLSFAFAKRHGVLVKRFVNGVAECAYRADTTPMALAEVRRFLRTKVKLERVDEPEFDALLRTAYEGGTSETMQAAE